METHNLGSPVTDGEQWSDDTERSSDSGTSPQHFGYAPLGQYQALGTEEEEEEENEEGEEQGEEKQGGQDASAGEVAEAWRGVADDGESSESASEGGQQGDVRA